MKKYRKVNIIILNKILNESQFARKEAKKGNGLEWMIGDDKASC